MYFVALAIVNFWVFGFYYFFDYNKRLMSFPENYELVDDYNFLLGVIGLMEAKQKLMDIEVHGFRKPFSRLFQDYGHSHTFCLKLDSGYCERICHYNYHYEKSHHIIKSITSIIKSIVPLEVYGKLRLYCSKVYDR